MVRISKKYLKKHIRWMVTGTIVRTIRLFCKSRYMVLFQSFEGGSYSDSPKCISEALHDINKDVEIVWAFKDPELKKNVVPEYVKCIKIGDCFEYFKALAVTRVWVNNFSFPYIPKGKRQYFIQTWHGDRSFKKVLNDSGYRESWNKAPEGIPGYCDLAIAASDYGEMVYHSAFGYNGKILRVGMPRNDSLIKMDASKIERIKKELGVSQKKKILLYAPTLRQQNQRTRTEQEIAHIDFRNILDLLNKKYQCEWVILLRAHPAVVGLSFDKDLDNVIDVSSYEDMADLLLISDCLITDYSSCAGDFVLMNKPVILVQTDRDAYVENDRAFYFNINTCPYWIATNQEEIITIISNMSSANIADNCKAVLEFYNTDEYGESSMAVATIINERLHSEMQNRRI